MVHRGNLLGGVALVARVELRCRGAVFLSVDFLVVLGLVAGFLTAVLSMVFLTADFLGAVVLATGFFAARGIVGVADEKILTSLQICRNSSEISHT